MGAFSATRVPGIAYISSGTSLYYSKMSVTSLCSDILLPMKE